MEFNLSPVVKNLLFINIGVFLVQELLHLPLFEYFGLYYIHSDRFLPFQYFTYMFLHADFRHLFGNMLGVVVFGPMLERFWGSKRFLTFYFIAGVGASVLFSAVNYYEMSKLQMATVEYVKDPTPGKFVSYIDSFAEAYYDLEFVNSFEENAKNQAYINKSVDFVKEFYTHSSSVPMIGASGALFGILMAFAMLFPNTELFMFFIPFPIKAKYLVAFYGLYELYSEYVRLPGDNVAHLAHLGGMLVGFIVVKYWNTQRDNFY